MSEVQGKKLENSETQLRDSNQKQAIQMNAKGAKVPLKNEDQNKVDQKLVQKIPKEQSKPLIKKTMLQESSNGQKDEDHKKKRVDKNKCRCCGESTIPVILGLINQQSLTVESNQGITMRNIRENIFQRAQDQSQGNPENKTKAGQNIPYIPLNYLHQIVICKRCRFKFHSTCLTERGLDCTKLQENWICTYCEAKIKELQSQNQWDYENNKKRKKDDPLPQRIKLDEPSLIKKRIGENKEIFKILKNSKISPRMTDEERKDRFFKDYPYYRHPDGHHIAYPIFDEKDKYKTYGNIIEYKQKPSYCQIQIEYFSQLLGLQSTMNILGVNISLDSKKYSSSQLFPFLIIMLSLYWEELLSDRRFEFYQRVLDPQAGAFFQLLRFMVSQCNEDEIFETYVKIWAYFYKNIEKTFDDMDDDLKQILSKESQITTIELMNLIQNVQESIYNLESFCLLMGQREIINFENISAKEKQIKFYEEHPKAFINTGQWIGIDQDNRSYFWFKEHASMIFVEDRGKWGYYIDDEIYDLMDSLETRGIREQTLLKNLEALEESDMLIPDGHPQAKYKLEIGSVTQQEICKILLDVEEMIQSFLQQRYCRWAKKDVREQYRKGLQDPNPNIVFHLNCFVEGLQAIEKIELHPKFKKQDPEIVESSESEESQESEQSSSMKHARTRANHNHHPKPASIITQVPKPAKKEKLPLPPFHELEAQLHSSRRTQTKIFFFNQHLKNPLRTVISGLTNKDLQGIYFAVLSLQLLLTDYAKKKTEMRMETKEKRKRGRKAKSQIEEELEQIKEAPAPVPVPVRKDLFSYTIKYFEAQANKPELKSPEPEQEIIKEVKADGIANRREKRGTAGKRYNLVNNQSTRKSEVKPCPKCSKLLPSVGEFKCKKCLRVFHKECMNNDICKICPQLTRSAAAKKNNGKQVFIDE